jgi:hypothetical protein
MIIKEDYEYQLEDRVVEDAEAQGWKVRKMTSPGRRGAFDRLFIKEGRHVHIEFKRKKDGRPSKLQVIEYAALLKHGAEAYFCGNYDKAILILNLENKDD